MPALTTPSLSLVQAIRTLLAQVTGIPPVSYLNVDFDPPADRRWVEERTWRATVVHPELGPQTGLQRQHCLYQLDVIAPANEGPDAAFNLADAILTKLRTLTLTSPGERTSARVMQAMAGPAFPEPPDQLRIPLTLIVDLDF